MGVSHSFITEWDNSPKEIMEFARVIDQDNVLKSFNDMVNHQIPNLDDFCWACTQAAAHFKKFPNYVQIDPQPKDRLIFIGDMHGCFETLIRLFIGDEQTQIEPLGFPGPQSDGTRNVYLFNGDLVDRGGSGYQIVFCLSLMALLWPDFVLINRGNHESEMFGLSTQTGMGHKFMFEVQGKFPDVDFSKYKPAVSDLFYSLPICHSFDRNVFVVHGGVPLASDVSGVQFAPTNQFESRTAKVNVPKNVPPYNINDLQSIQPTRFQTQNLEDTPKKKNELWHSFLWSYDRAPYSADFMEFNNFKTMVNSHTATPYHFVTTFLPLDKCADKYGVQSVTRGDDTFKKVKEFFDQHPNLTKIKMSIVEIFSSPTNQGSLYACVLMTQDGEPGQKIDWDPLNWGYHNLGSHTDFKFYNAPSVQ
ncbi:Serine/threonine-protein phosphatase [Spironucleus salmonicida]|uniref:Serine/threonine-protein phosphatase n=1 Tax=Spironucleus salmonicida TaxID=348837 RepID=V6LJP9_9EUKA|nr:Serine/threonine-protein phosphatase [Spironucleus salmonicida]|eukprot:EST44820.1 Serine/threonine-protein phosphatase [Spironucleus salmonicida]